MGKSKISLLDKEFCGKMIQAYKADKDYINSKTDTSSSDYYINELTYMGRVEEVATLLSLKANIYMIDRFGSNIIQSAIRGMSSSLKQLIEIASDEKKDICDTKKYYNRYNNCKTIFSMLLKYEAEIKAQNLEKHEQPKLIDHINPQITTITLQKSAFIATIKPALLETYKTGYEKRIEEIRAAGRDDIILPTVEELADMGNILVFYNKEVANTELYIQECEERVSKGEKLQPNHIQYLSATTIDLFASELDIIIPEYDISKAIKIEDIETVNQKNIETNIEIIVNTSNQADHVSKLSHRKRAEINEQEAKDSEKKWVDSAPSKALKGNWYSSLFNYFDNDKADQSKDKSM